MAAAGDKCRQRACVRVSMCLRAGNIDWLLASSLPGLVVGDKRRRIREAVGGHIAPRSAHFLLTTSAEKCQDPDVSTLANIFIFFQFFLPAELLCAGLAGTSWSRPIGRRCPNRLVRCCGPYVTAARLDLDLGTPLEKLVLAAEAVA